MAAVETAAGPPAVDRGQSRAGRRRPGDGHAAFDQYILGIRPDYLVKLRADIRDETDGPMLKHGLQGLHNTRIVIPKSKVQRQIRDF